MGDIGVVRNKAPVEVGEAKEGVNVLHLGGGRPARNPVELNRIHSQLARFTIIPRYSTSSVANLHFSSFK